MCGHNRALYFEARKANSSSTQTGLVVFVTIRFSGVFVVPLYEYHNCCCQKFTITRGLHLTLSSAGAHACVFYFIIIPLRIVSVAGYS